MKYKDLNNDGPYRQFNIIEAVCKGQDKLAQIRREEPSGIVRGGSTGAIIDGEIHGICPRVAYLRYNGINTPLPQEIELMTKQGEHNEDIWKEELVAGLPEGYEVKDQTEFECVADITEDIKFSGSPDLVIFDKNLGQPILGIENKNLSSVSTVKSVHYELQPKQDHLIQAANYSLRMQNVFGLDKPLPYQLVYSNRSIWHVFAMSAKVKNVILKRPVDVEFKYGKPMSIKPFHRIYHLNWNEDGCLEYWTDGYDSPVVTKLTKESIDLYYEVVAHKIKDQNNLGPRPSTKHLDGSSTYSPCNYCNFKDICASKDNLTPQEFLDSAVELNNEMWNEREDHLES